MKIKFFFRSFIFMFIGLFFISANGQVETESSPCTQDKDEKLRLLKIAEENQYNIRYIEIVGNTYTRYPTFREHWERNFNEGDIFTQKTLLKSIEGINKLKTIKPITLGDIKIRLEENDKRGWNAIDFTICVQQVKRFLTDKEKADLIKSIEDADSKRYRIDRITIIGNSTTRHTLFAEKMSFNEGDIFTRKALEESIRSISGLKQIYPIGLNDVEVFTDQETKTIDLIFYVVERN